MSGDRDRSAFQVCADDSGRPHKNTLLWTGADDDPAVTVHIKLAHGTLTLTPIFDHDWFDLTTMHAINLYIRNTGIQFYRYDDSFLGQFAFIVALRDDERQDLRATRGWRLL